jgi:hypothetical protein
MARKLCFGRAVFCCVQYAAKFVYSNIFARKGTRSRLATETVLIRIGDALSGSAGDLEKAGRRHLGVRKNAGRQPPAEDGAGIEIDAVGPQLRPSIEPWRVAVHD